MTVYMQGKVIYIAQEEKWAQNGTLRHTWGYMHPLRALPIYYYALGSVLEKLGDLAVKIPPYAKVF